MRTHPSAEQPTMDEAEQAEQGLLLWCAPAGSWPAQS